MNRLLSIGLLVVLVAFGCNGGHIGDEDADIAHDGDMITDGDRSDVDAEGVDAGPRCGSSCDDDNACTDDRCDPDVGCVNEPNSSPCDDGDPCNGSDTCDEGLCLLHTGDACGNGACDCDETTSSCPADCCEATLTSGARRGGDTPVLTRGSYDYVPSVMSDGVYRMWWCGGVAGDHILYAEADGLDGPWHAHGSTTPGSYDDVFGPTGNSADFDGEHTCDPSVVRVNGTYYMYYGGYPGGDGETTRIGVASSPDGLTWSRMNGGRPIVVPARDWTTVVNGYGAGQPSAVYLDGDYYLIFTDTTAVGCNPGNGAGQFVLRSADPTFQTDVEELGADGFAPYDEGAARPHRLLESFSVDWQYIDAVDAFAVASHTSGGVSRLFLYDRTLGAQLAMLEVAAAWTEGPGLVSRPDKHGIPGTRCGDVPIDVMRSVGPEGPSTWDLAHVGYDMSSGLGCECLDLGRVYEGSLLVSAGLPLTMVRGGVRLQFALEAPARRLARSSYSVTSEMFHAIPYGASMHAGDEVLGAPGRPAAFHLDDDRLWPASCLELITDNGSSISSVTVEQFDAIPIANSLYCLQ